MSDRTWEDIGNEIRDDYLRDGGPENVRFREVQWEVWLAEVERAAAVRALTDAADRVTEWGNDHSVWWDDENEVYDEPSNWLRARAEAYRQEREEQ